MTERIRCPGCQVVLRVTGEGPALRCPKCGARLSSGARPKTAAGMDVAPAPPAAKAATAPPSDSSPKPKKKRSRRKQQSSFDFMGPLTAAGAALLLLAVSYGFSEVVRYSTGDASPPAPHASTNFSIPGVGDPAFGDPPAGEAVQVAWEGKPDPPPQPAQALAIPDGPGVPMKGDPLFAQGDGPFVVDTPWHGPNLISRLLPKEGDSIPVHDLAAGKPLGALPKGAQRGKQSLLSPDGRRLIAPALAGGSPAPFEVWTVGSDQPTATLQVAGGVFWMDFVSPGELVTACQARTGPQLQVWDLSKGEALQTFSLPELIFPAPPQAAALMHKPDRLSGSISPGRKYLALGGPSGVALLTLADGQLVGTLPLQEEGKKLEYRGLRFSPDGAGLSGVFAYTAGLGPKEKPAVVLKTWKMADGKPSREITLADSTCFGPPLPGPSPEAAILNRAVQVDGRTVPNSLVIDLGTGEAAHLLPFCVIRWLADDRLLVFGPSKDAPMGWAVYPETYDRKNPDQ